MTQPQQPSFNEPRLSGNTVEIVRSYVYLGLLVVVILVGLVKIWQTPFSFQEVRLSDILALVLAIFSIWLSVSFFHRATEQSNQFYNNTYSFTKDITSLLSKIEGEFRQRLEHLDVSYTRMSDRLPPDIYTKTKAIESEIKEQEAVVQVTEAAREQALNEIGTKLQSGERDKLLAEIRERDQALYKARADLNRLQNTLSPRPIESAQRVVAFIRDGVEGPFGAGDLFSRSYNEIRHQLETAIDSKSVPSGFVTDLRTLHVLDPDNRLTPEGLLRLHRIVRTMPFRHLEEIEHDTDDDRG